MGRERIGIRPRQPSQSRPSLKSSQWQENVEALPIIASEIDKAAVDRPGGKKRL